MLTTVTIAIVAFALTNIDDIFLLTGFFSDPSQRPVQIIVGQYVGIGFLIAASGLCASLYITVLPEYVGVLGLLPILIGIKKLWQTHNANVSEEHMRGSSASVMLTVASTTIADGSDNLGIYTPLFAAMTTVQLIASVIVFLVMTGALCIAAQWFVHNKNIGVSVQYFGYRSLPYVLIALGCYILVHAGSIALL